MNTCAVSLIWQNCRSDQPPPPPPPPTNHSNPISSNRTLLSGKCRWQAQFYFEGQSRYIGVFDASHGAALAYECVHRLLTGFRKLARLRKPPHSLASNSKAGGLDKYGLSLSEHAKPQSKQSPNNHHHLVISNESASSTVVQRAVPETILGDGPPSLVLLD